MSAEQPKCGTIKDDGTPCRSWVACEKCGRCWAHCEHVAEERRQAQLKGAATTNERKKGDGLTPSELPPLTDHEAAETWCAVVGQAAATGRLSSSAANAVLRSVQTWMDARDEGKVSERLDQLQDALAEWRKTGSPEAVLEVVEGDQP